MSDQRGYDLANTISSYDDDVYFNVDKSGFSRSKKYKASVLKGHLKVGDQQYTEENYVTNDETLTVSVDELDMALQALSDTVGAYTGISVIKVSLTSGQVDGLGSAFTLMAAPVTSNTAYQIIDIKWGINPSAVLDVESQNLEIYFDTISDYMALIRNNSVEKASRFIRGVQIQAEHEIGINKALLCKLSESSNPDSGSATMNFYIIYKIITVPAIIV